MIYAWQQQVWQQLLHTHRSDRLPHALLLTGMRGVGKKDFATHLVSTLLCQVNKEDSCGDCHMCRLVAGRAHPDVLWVEPEKVDGAIKIDQVREVTDFIQQTALQGSKRFVLIDPADQLNTNAANALLKTLEEPPAASFIILISSQPSRLPATIRSRCQQIFFKRPSEKVALDWLASQKESTDWPLLLRLVDGAPLAARQLADQDIIKTRKTLFQAFGASSQQVNPLMFAANMGEAELLQVLDFTLSWTLDLLRLQLGCQEVMNKDYSAELMRVEARTTFSRLTHFMDYVQKLRAQIALGVNLNKQLILESLFIRWMDALHAAS